MSERDEQHTPREAVGLRYASDGNSAPRVIARGRGELAERILAVAEEHGVPVRRDPDLLQLLAVSQVGDEIPTEVYGAVAQLISFLWGLNAQGADELNLTP